MNNLPDGCTQSMLDRYYQGAEPIDDCEIDACEDFDLHEPVPAFPFVEDIDCPF